MDDRSCAPPGSATSASSPKPANETCEVLIVGAGPAGIAAALTAHAAGRSVLVIDKARFPRDKCCGDGLTTLAVRELELLGFSPERLAGWKAIDGAWIRSPSGREVHVPLMGPGIYAAVAPRLEFDNALVELARHRGIEVRDGHRAIGPIDEGGDGTDEISIGIEGPAGESRVRARYVIAADGMWSPIRSQLGLTPAGYRGEWHAFRQYVSGVEGSAAERLHVWFEADLLPGYAWSFPLPGGRANLGFGIRRTAGLSTGEMGRVWRDLITRPHIVDALGSDATLEGRHSAWPIPARVDTIALCHGRVLFVGDAAAATDVLTGEGIGQALLSGRLAAQAITTAGATAPARARRIYERSVRHHLVADHKMSALLGRILTSERAARGAVRLIDASGQWGRRNFARWMFEDEPRAVAVTPSRWHRQFLARPGAFRSAS
jgi:geranylgeranyl reductase family protein